MYLVGLGHHVAVIAVDPSSSRHGGSILGDKTRMTELSRHPSAYVRPSPTQGALGGVAQHTNDVVLLCESAGYDIVLVETVGLGQSEVAIDSTVDMLLLVVPPAGGDELQGVKKGIVEVADTVVVNKCDGELEKPAMMAAAEYRRALQLIRWKHNAWQPQVMRVSALTGFAVDELWATAAEFHNTMSAGGHLESRRARQNVEWMWSQFEVQLVRMGRDCKLVHSLASEFRARLAAGLMTPRRAGHMLLDAFLSSQAPPAAPAPHDAQLR